MLKITKEMHKTNLSVIEDSIIDNCYVKVYTEEKMSVGKFRQEKDFTDLMMKGFVRFASKAILDDNGNLLPGKLSKIVEINKIHSVVKIKN